ncbi:MAG: PEP/pyruvate-binding domain-containing protein [Alistipes onderdonkii]
MPEALVEELRVYIRHATKPLAIRSSSKLEDSHYQPFAGIYSTYMIPLTDNEDQTLRLLGKAIKSVYASVYFASSRAYIQASDNLLGEEKMGIVIQEVCGSEDNGYFSRPFRRSPLAELYPTAKSRRTASSIGLRAGQLVVEATHAACPATKTSNLDDGTGLAWTRSARHAPNLKPEESKMSIDKAPHRLINKAKHFRNTPTWLDVDTEPAHHRQHVRCKIITFHRLKYDTIPLAEIVRLLRTVRRRCAARSRIRRGRTPGADRTFSFLQTVHRRLVGQPFVSPDGHAPILRRECIGTGANEGLAMSSRTATRLTWRISRTQRKSAPNNKMREAPLVLVGPVAGPSDPWSPAKGPISRRKSSSNADSL